MSHVSNINGRRQLATDLEKDTDGVLRQRPLNLIIINNNNNNKIGLQEEGEKEESCHSPALAP